MPFSFAMNRASRDRRRRRPGNRPNLSENRGSHSECLEIINQVITRSNTTPVAKDIQPESPPSIKPFTTAARPNNPNTATTRLNTMLCTSQPNNGVSNLSDMYLLIVLEPNGTYLTPSDQVHFNPEVLSHREDFLVAVLPSNPGPPKDVNKTASNIRSCAIPARQPTRWDQRQTVQRLGQSPCRW